MPASARARGALYGLAIGDALGMPAQLLSRGQVTQRWGPLLTGFEPAPPGHPIAAGLPAGAVTDDTSAFSAARQRGLAVQVLEYVYPEPVYNDLKQRFDAERAGTHYTYSFPDGAGDCNCAQFPAMVGIPVPEATGRMARFVERMQAAATPQRFGDCEG